ncbi:hypothetical protein [Winogradskyella flava]|uniref:hypothetical protein n=1 Tax=Winogradskyella flava TaxID=1884876 RepID=UPI0024922ECC|nr:hypothetical protein [Winogradskyella flava]
MNSKYKMLRQSALMVFFVVLGISSFTLEAQEGTIYYNAQWKETTKDSAVFYRPLIKKEGDLYRIEDYYISGQLQMSGLSETKERNYFKGEVTWYNEDGSISQKANYEDGKLNGEYISFLNGKKLTGVYKNNRLVSGSINAKNYSTYCYATINNDTIKEVYHENNLEGVRYENYRVVDGATFLSKYYDEKGDLIGARETTNNSYFKGLEVFYYYQPMRVRQVNYYPKERLLGTTYYYPNGTIRTRFEQSPEYKKSFYDPSGKLLGSATYRLDRDYLKPVNGTEYVFEYAYKDEDQGKITSKRIYKNEQLLEDAVFYKNGSIKSITKYKGRDKDLQISYNEYGEEIARMKYEGYYPFEGTEILRDRETIYKNGELVSEINYYPDTKIIFSKKNPSEETYYDRAGNLLGTLEVLYENKYAKPINGQRYYVGYKTDISSIETYKDGQIVERTTFRERGNKKEDVKIYKRVEKYDDNGYNRISETTFYSNGAKQSEITLKGGYDKIKGKFYNNKNELIGSYDYLKKNGELYEFFDDSDVIRLYKKESNGKLLNLKRHNYGPNYRYDDIDAVLEEEIDVTCCSKVYTADGKLFAEATYKNGEPWEGQIYDETNKSIYAVDSGQRNGPYIKYDYNLKTVLEEGKYADDKKEGSFNYYNYTGDLEKIENFENDQLHGESLFFNKKGERLSSLIYQNGLPYDGIKVIKVGYNKQPTQEIYAQGQLVQKITFDDNGKRITDYKDGTMTKTVAYYKGTDKKRLSYTVENYYINGEVIRFDKNGIVAHKATFVNNKLESGTVFLKPFDTYDNRVSHAIVSYVENKLSVAYIGKDDNIIFSAEEIIEPGDYTKYLSKMNIYLDNMSPESLY